MANEPYTGEERRVPIRPPMLERHVQTIGAALVPIMLLGISWLVATSFENEKALSVLSIQYKALDDKFTQRFTTMENQVSGLFRKIEAGTPATIKLESMDNRLERAVNRLRDHMHNKDLHTAGDR